MANSSEDCGAWSTVRNAGLQVEMRVRVMVRLQEKRKASAELVFY